ncbi:sensor histidine kinase [Hymenobacter negativus]|uniref:histidine kinase n=1 Tax=Hymenobacter negativus TaxID=2795026 RepID=A0ABS3QGZ0_9BACT|nr:ATP-binding protein [Hymenobacter negativus]MBO2010386.1 PAS domain-containing sensor histidine kinase [Hymenobacter negativus]
MLPTTDFLQQALDVSPQTFFVYDADAGRMLFVSAAYEQLFPDLQRENATTDLPRLLAYLPHDDQQYALHCLAELIAGNHCDDLLLRLQPHPNVPLRWLSMQAQRSLGPEGQVLLSGTLEDVTVEQEYLRNADKYMAKKNTTLEILSHDLAGPFNMLQQLAEFLEERTKTLQDEQVQRMLRIMRDTCRDSVTLIRDFVDGEFMDSANVDFKPLRVDLVQNIAQIVDTYQQGEHLVAKHFTFHHSQPTIYAEIDNNKFLQVINNLVSNAIKFTREGGNIAVGLTQQPDHVLVTVADDGIGIPAHLLPVLFDRFTKARRPGLRGEKTTGLGMHIIETIVRLHHGRIWVESEENVGTTFYIQLPIPTRAPGVDASTS